MPEPSVCAILLTADRPEYTRQAVQSFRAQTYANKSLLIFDSGKEELDWLSLVPVGHDPCKLADFFRARHAQATIGELRNAAIAFSIEWENNTIPRTDIFVTWDSDDYSHPNRIAEQVQLLQSSGADAVGYNELLFWREPRVCSQHEAVNCMQSEICARGIQDRRGESWLYSNKDTRYPPGSSLCYWRKAWEVKPFAATSIGEDEKFCRGLKVVSVSCLPQRTSPLIGMPEPPAGNDPRMIARIHAGNTSTAYKPESMRRAAEWSKVPAWDKYCQGVMA